MPFKKSIFATLSVGWLAFSAYAYAAAAYSISYAYYSDASYSEQVGEGQFHCNGGTTVLWGQSTSYKVEQTRESCRSGDPYTDPWGN